MQYAKTWHFGIVEHGDTFPNDNHGMLNGMNTKDDFIDDMH